ncbi:hypothetical protein SH449x_005254 [Pirellulaceae bacterium SH449]
MDLLRLQMTIAEISHWIGFLFVAAFAVYQSYNISLIFGLAMMIPNAYPSLLQQENKRRLDKIMHCLAKR